MLLPCYYGKSIISFKGEKRGISMKIKEVIVVEGRDDSAKIKQAVNADTIETNGSAINQVIFEQIKHAKEKRGVIVFTDPDYPGQRIRHLINQAVPGCKHAFLTKEEARAKSSRNKSLGIEHASIEAIRSALAKVYELQADTKSEIAKEDIIHHKLIGGTGAKWRRERLGEKLQIGYTNGKQLLKRLTMFNITKFELDQAMKQIKKEEEDGE